MSKVDEKESEVFEIIELVSDDLDILTKAFEVIQEACEDEQRKIDFVDFDTSQIVH